MDPDHLRTYLNLAQELVTAAPQTPVILLSHTADKRADEQAIELNATLADLEDLPEYREVEFQTPDPAAGRTAGYDPTYVRFWVMPYGAVVMPLEPIISKRVRIEVNESLSLPLEIIGLEPLVVGFAFLGFAF